MASNEVQILCYFTKVHFQVHCTFQSINFSEGLLLRYIFNIDISTFYFYFFYLLLLLLCHLINVGLFFFFFHRDYITNAVTCFGVLRDAGEDTARLCACLQEWERVGESRSVPLLLPHHTPVTPRLTAERGSTIKWILSLRTPLGHCSSSFTSSTHGQIKGLLFSFLALTPGGCFATYANQNCRKYQRSRIVSEIGKLSVKNCCKPWTHHASNITQHKTQIHNLYSEVY